MQLAPIDTTLDPVIPVCLLILFVMPIAKTELVLHATQVILSMDKDASLLGSKILSARPLAPEESAQDATLDTSIIKK